MTTSQAAPASSELARQALDVAREAAALVRDRATREVTVAATKSSDVDVVTQTDRDSEVLIRRRLAERRPGDGFLGEEGDDVESATGVRWIVDPIDGTVNFLYGLGSYAVSIAAERDGEVVAGVVVDVPTGTEYVGHLAEEDAPATATRDGVPIEVRGPQPMSQRLVATGFSYDRAVRVRQAEALTRLIPLIRDIRRIGSCALDLCRVADGTLDAYVEEGVNLWDHAAAGLIARVAGARTLVAPGAGGKELLICAPGHGFDEFRAAVESAGFACVPGE